ncbi:MAG: GNAT family N-acetyltransferase [Salinibacterium sp.]|nr:GNAT family N-acetyltransferase [Salinibacterium sp.]
MIRDILPSDRSSWEALFLAYGQFYETAFEPHVIEGVWAWLMDATAPVSAVVALGEPRNDPSNDVDGDRNSGVTGPVIGFAHYRRTVDTFTAGPAWHLDDLFIDPDARKGGHATALIAAVVDRATAGGGGTLRWITASDNLGAQRIYDRVANRMTWVTYEQET